MKFGNYMEKLRQESGLTFNKLAELTGVSPGYISKLKNNVELIPSQQVTFKMAQAFATHGINEKDISTFIHYLKYDKRFVKKMFKSDIVFSINDKNEYITNKDKAIDKYIDIQYMAFVKNEIDDRENELKRLKTNFLENKFIAPKKSDSITMLENTDMNWPMFDLAWLLEQERFNLFYGREYDINDKENEFYNQITHEDKKMINRLVKTYFMTKYDKENNVYSRSSEELDELIKNAQVKEVSDNAHSGKDNCER